MKHLKFPLVLILAISISAGCASDKTYVMSHDKLSRNIKLFNADFESRAVGVSAVLVKTDLRENYMLKAPEIKQKVTFDESSIIKVEYLKNGAPIKLTGSEPAEDFNECIVTLRYRLTILPGNKLETRIIKQKWVMEGEQDWVVIPDLAAFSR